MQAELLELIREIIESELDEVSVTTSIVGATTPLGTDATYPDTKVKKKKHKNKLNNKN